MRLRCINTILECPRFRTHPSWKRHIRELRERLPDLLRTKRTRWMPMHRKVYAVLVCLFPDLAHAYVRIRFRRLRKELVFKEHVPERLTRLERTIPRPKNGRGIRFAGASAAKAGRSCCRSRW